MKIYVPRFSFIKKKIQIFNSAHSYTKYKGLFSALTSFVKQYLVFFYIKHYNYFIFFIIYKSCVTVLIFQLFKILFTFNIYLGLIILLMWANDKIWVVKHGTKFKDYM